MEMRRRRKKRRRIHYGCIASDIEIIVIEYIAWAFYIKIERKGLAG